MNQLTRDEYNNLTTELDETIKAMFTKDISEITQEEQQRIEEIAEKIRNAVVKD